MICWILSAAGFSKTSFSFLSRQLMVKMSAASARHMVERQAILFMAIFFIVVISKWLDKRLPSVGRGQFHTHFYSILPRVAPSALSFSFRVRLYGLSAYPTRCGFATAWQKPSQQNLRVRWRGHKQ